MKTPCQETILDLQDMLSVVSAERNRLARELHQKKMELTDERKLCAAWQKAFYGLKNTTDREGFLKRQVNVLNGEVQHWRNNHDHQVQMKRNAVARLRMAGWDHSLEQAHNRIKLQQEEIQRLNKLLADTIYKAIDEYIPPASLGWPSENVTKD